MATAKKRVLVTGATGFIGRNMAEGLAQDDRYEVIGVTHHRPAFIHPKIRFITADLTNANDVNRVMEGIDVLVQAAATTSGAKDIVSRPYIHVTDNAVMNSLLFRAALEHQIEQVVFFSCTIMYPTSDIPLKESDFDANRELNKNYFGGGWTKIYLEKMCEFYSQMGPTKYSVIRHSNIYGPHDKFDLEKSHVFGATVTKVMTAKDTVTVWGDGSEERDLLYVDDLLRYVKLIMSKQQDPLLLHNVGLGKSIRISDLVETMVKISGRNLKVDYDLTKPSLKTKLCLDISKAVAFGWKPTIELSQGIKKTLDWYSKYVSVRDVGVHETRT